MASESQQLHQSYLLRVWRAGNGNAPEWRMSLEDVITHERHGFVDLASMMLFLEQQIGDGVRSRPVVEPSDAGVVEYKEGGDQIPIRHPTTISKL